MTCSALGIGSVEDIQEGGGQERWDASTVNSSAPEDVESLTGSPPHRCQ